MQNGRPRIRIRYRTSNTAVPASGWFGKMLAVVLAGVALTAALVFSIIFFAILAAVALIGGGYLWWKTRALRRQLREQFAAAQARAANAHSQGDVIEGEFARAEQDRSSERLQDRIPR